MGLHDFANLRDVHEVTPNRRLGKYLLIQNGVYFDIYVEKNTDLAISYEDVQRFSQVISGIRCACREHLTILKLRALENRAQSSKGGKDAKDIVKHLVLLSEPESR